MNYCPYTFKCCFMRHAANLPNGIDERPYTYPGNLPEAINLIREAVSGEREDELFYDYLIKNSPNEESRNIIVGIRDNESKHNRMFRQIYHDLTGENISELQNEEMQYPEHFCDGVKRALYGELAAVERYRKILFAMQSRIHINMLTEIITDEIRHANFYNFLYSMNRCFRM
ncbi:rubrerythrin [Clostridium sp. WLY-B-L2]|uniref:Rubrerythrin n=1 Tax=Clostridium aromativorans TaxID=2836848 RepID=A0ABS8NBJ4_9CLOT|nr:MULTISPECIES: ferritin family protein [Clostridium]KAA8674643.1 rubrerythrin [Clostridium sp. HV4-5-A1G]MCC9296073.1 rubrerythrin [Clostridium aromativorans]CAB1246124.1 Rubrerythrin [Clostridiaceae bacterium BL-3]